MPVNVRILPAPGLVLLRYAGEARIDETLEAMDTCSCDPAFDPAFPHLVDLSAVSAFQADYPDFLALQARAADRWSVSRSFAFTRYALTF